MRTLQARPLAGPSVAAAALVVATVCVLPLLVIGAQATGQGWGATRAQLLRPRVAELLGNTLALVGVTVTACVVLGVTAAWLVERTTLPGASVWRVLLVAPLAVPAPEAAASEGCLAGPGWPVQESPRCAASGVLAIDGSRAAWNIVVTIRNMGME